MELHCPGLEKQCFFEYDRYMKNCYVIKVTAAVLRRGDRYLVCRRTNGLWEFPGGKIEPGETPEQCLARECREELAVEVTVGRLLDCVRTCAEDGKMLELHFFEVTLRAGEPVASVHTEICYARPEMLARLQFCPADQIFLEHGILGKGISEL